MQYFRNAPRCSMGRTDPRNQDMFPLCRYDRTPPKEAEVPLSPCGCKSSAVKPDPVSMPQSGTAAQMKKSGCGCKTDSPMSYCDCEKTPRSEDFGCSGLAMAFVPEQEFCDMNEPDEALCRGSLFQKLDMPFYGKKGRCGK